MCTDEDVEAATVAAGTDCSSGNQVSIGRYKGYLGAGVYLGAFPAQPLHVTTVRPPMHDICSGSRFNKDWVELAIVMGVEGIEKGNIRR